MYCKSCGAIIAADSAFCSTCGKAIEPPDSSPSPGGTSQYSAPIPAPLSLPPMSAPYPAPSNGVFVLDTPQQNIFPALAQWKTSIGMSILGVLTAYALDWMFTYISRTSSNLPLLIFGLMVSLASLVFTYIYIFVIYPSYFRNDPKLENSSLISFLNCFVGGLIFGPLWNHNLTNGAKGISYIVYAVIGGILVFADFYLAFG